MRKSGLLLGTVHVSVLVAAGVGLGGEVDEFEADLRGRSEVPLVETDAGGEAGFTLTDDGLEYELEAEKIDNVSAGPITW